MALLSNGLLPASFRGVPFAVYSTNAEVGRRVALHQYPGRDEPWAEDMGRGVRRYRFRGFLVTGDTVYFGGPVALQRLLLLATAEKSGPGTMTHPTLGVLNVSCSRCSIGEERDAGRYSEIEFEFVESGKRTFPSLLSSSSGLLSAANLCKVALALDGVRLIAAAISSGSRRQDVAAATTSWSTKSADLGADATAVYSLAAQLPGEFGRYSRGGNAGVDGARPTSYDGDTTVSDLVAVTSAARVAIAEAGAAVQVAVATANLISAASIASTITALVDALAAACADPADAIRLLEQLVAYVPVSTLNAATAAIAGMFQRAAAAALTFAVADYQPSSADDAWALLARLAALLDSLATAAADAGEDESFGALRAARVAVVNDLRTRGTSLARIASFSFAGALPSLALAQRIYRDPDRADQLVRQANPRHPLFMPTSFEALAA